MEVLLPVLLALFHAPVIERPIKLPRTSRMRPLHAGNARIVAGACVLLIELLQSTALAAECLKCKLLAVE